LRQHSSGFYIGIVVSIILGFGIVAGIALGLRSISGLGYEPDVYQATKTGPNSATLELSTYPDSQVCHSDAGNPQIHWVTYCGTIKNVQGANIEVPPNSVITVIIKNYDSKTPLINPFFRQVQGTIGGTETVNGKTVSEVNATDVSHTFAIQSNPETSNPLFINAPIVGVDSGVPTPITINGNQYAQPNVISFQFRTGPTGTYIWHCYDPCGDQLGRNPPFGFSGPMSTTGYMAGMITVASY